MIFVHDFDFERTLGNIVLLCVNGRFTQLTGCLSSVFFICPWGRVYARPGSDPFLKCVQLIVEFFEEKHLHPRPFRCTGEGLGQGGAGCKV